MDSVRDECEKEKRWMLRKEEDDIVTAIYVYHGTIYYIVIRVRVCVCVYTRRFGALTAYARCGGWRLAGIRVQTGSDR